MIRLLGEDGRKTQLIGQAEILPMLVSRILWSGRMQNRDVIHYVDNDAARYSCIKGGSPSLGSAWLIQGFWETEVMNRSLEGLLGRDRPVVPGVRETNLD